jgi:hypothetical protein
MPKKTIYELFQVSSNPRKNDHYYSNYKIYNSSLYMEAECVVEYNLEDDITDEEFEKLVEKELKNIMETLETYGRYPMYGIPKYVMY